MNFFTIILISILVIVVLAVAVRFLESSSSGGSKSNKPKYHYRAKNYVMTQREREFFQQLNDILGSKWYVVPQVHLSALLDHKIKGQNWSAAFKHINGKSVDFVLLSKETTKPVCAIELDDSTHERADRVLRDAEIERIFMSTNIPLARFAKPEKMSRQEIVNTIAQAIKSLK